MAAFVSVWYSHMVHWGLAETYSATLQTLSFGHIGDRPPSQLNIPARVDESQSVLYSSTVRDA